MQRRRMLMVVAMATVLGLVTSLFVYRAVRNAQGQAMQTGTVLVAAVNIGLGENLTKDHVKVVSWPSSEVPPGSVDSVKNAEGRVARSTIFAGEPILESKLAPTGQGGLMPILVPAGKRAVTIKVDEAIQRSGFILPNSRVDVLVTMARKPGEARETRIVLQDVLVLASDQTVEMKDNKPVTMTTVTMAMSPEETERLALAQNEGKVTLALRNLKDDKVVSTAGVTTAQLLGNPAPAPQAPATAKPVAKPRRSVPATKQVAQTAQPAAPAAAQVQPAASSQTVAAPVEAVSVSVIRGTNATEYRFVKDSNRGWAEVPKKEGSK